MQKFQYEKKTTFFRNFQKQGRYSFVQQNRKKKKKKTFSDFQNQGWSDVDNQTIFFSFFVPIGSVPSGLNMPWVEMMCFVALALWVGLFWWYYVG